MNGVVLRSFSLYLIADVLTLTFAAQYYIICYTHTNTGVRFYESGEICNFHKHQTEKSLPRIIDKIFERNDIYKETGPLVPKNNQITPIDKMKRYTRKPASAIL